MAGSKLVKLLNNDPSFFYYNGNKNSGLGGFAQKSIKYGHDRPDSGDSGQPYIVDPIPSGRTNNNTDDGFVRGGWTLANKAALDDKARITKFLKDQPKGPLFIQRQIGLQLSNPKIETRKINLSAFGFLGDAASALFNTVNDFVPGPTRLYNSGANTLAQIPVTAFGTHFERHGLSPVQDDNTKYLAVVRDNNDNGFNRLIGLKDRLIKPNVTDPRSGNIVLGTINAILGAVNVFNTLIGRGTNPLLPTSPLLQPADLIIDQYSGGPNSSYGIGLTTIKRYDVTSNGFNIQNNQERLAPGTPTIDYSGDLGVSKDYFTSNFANNAYLTKNNLSNNGKTLVEPSTVLYTIPNAVSKYITLQEKVNSLQLYPSASVDSNTGAVPGLFRNAGSARYLSGLKKIAAFERYDANILSILFRIINPFDQTEDPIIFSAYMSGFRDNFDASWNEYNYVGRSESFFTYGKFKRNVSFNLDIPCFNKSDLYEKYRGLGQLASTTAGAYNENGLMGGVLIKLNVGNHIRGEYGILNNISYEIPSETSWDIDAKLALLIKVSFNFTIIHVNLPQYKANQGFYNHVNVANISTPNGILNTKKSTSDLIDYFSSDTKAALPTMPTATAFADIQQNSLDAVTLLRQQQAQDEATTNSLLLTPTNGVGTGFNPNASNPNQILGINDAVTQNRIQQQQTTNNLLRTVPF